MSSSKKMRIGIWMNNVSDKALVGEGISRVLAFVVKAIQKRTDMDVAIGCLPWMKKPIYDFLDDLNIDMNRIVFIVSSKRIPLLYRIKRYYDSAKKSKRKGDFKTIVRQILKAVAKRIVGVDSFTVAILCGVLLALPSAALIILLFMLKVCKKIGAVIAQKIGLDRFSKEFFKSIGLTKNLYYMMIEGQFEKLAIKANKTSDVDGWYIPYPINEHTKLLKSKPLILAVADVVYYDFPAQYVKHFPFPKFNNILNDNLRLAESTISYSNFIKENHVMREFKNPDKAFVIPHANISTYEYIEKLHKRTNLNLRELSDRIISKYIKRQTDKKDDYIAKYLNTFSFSDIKYIYISSQVREHKNYLTLFKVFEQLLRKEYMDFKIIMTGDYNAIPELKEFIFDRRLEFDIISLTQIPAKVHAAFYARAELTVVPTLFEGGFPGPFTESLSVGVPVILSDIPVVRELLSPSELELVTFDPYDADSLRSKILWALNNQEQLLNEEMMIYNRLGVRTWEDVGDEYVEVFKNSIEEYYNRANKKAI